MMSRSFFPLVWVAAVLALTTLPLVQATSAISVSSADTYTQTLTLTYKYTYGGSSIGGTVTDSNEKCTAVDDFSVLFKVVPSPPSNNSVAYNASLTTYTKSNDCTGPTYPFVPYASEWASINGPTVLTSAFGVGANETVPGLTVANSYKVVITPDTLVHRRTRQRILREALVAGTDSSN